MACSAVAWSTLSHTHIRHVVMRLNSDSDCRPHRRHDLHHGSRLMGFHASVQTTLMSIRLRKSYSNLYPLSTLDEYLKPVKT
jgi:hypothetical protein